MEIRKLTDIIGEEARAMFSTVEVAWVLNQMDAVRNIHRPEEYATYTDPKIRLVCYECVEEYPCPTMQALDIFQR